MLSLRPTTVGVARPRGAERGSHGSLRRSLHQPRTPGAPPELAIPEGAILHTAAASRADLEVRQVVPFYGATRSILAN